MIIFVGAIIFAIAFTALYCAMLCDVKWFRITVTSVVSFVIAMLVSTNLFY